MKHEQPHDRRTKLPLLKVCAREACGKVFEVSCPYWQARRKYCSKRCNGYAQVPHLMRGAAKGIAKMVATRRRMCLERVAGLTPLEAYRRGYLNGLYSKSVQLRKKYLLVKKAS